MVTFGEDAARLARAMAGLIATGPGRAGSLRGLEPPVVMTARDTVLAELRGLSRICLQNAESSLEATGPVLGSVMGIDRALHSLPRASTNGMPLDQALAVSAGPYCTRWQEAARAATSLEIYHDVLQGPALMPATRALAELARALPILDRDLATAMPGRAYDNANVNESVVEQLAASAADLLDNAAPLADAGPNRPFTPRVLPVHGLAAVSGAMRHLTALIERRGSNLTAHEMRAVARVLVTGTVLASRSNPRLAEALPPLASLVHMQIATLNQPSQLLLRLTYEIGHSLSPSSAPTGPTTGFSATWAEPSSLVAAALTGAVQKAALHGRLLMPWQSDETPGATKHLWVAADDAGLSQLLGALESTNSALEGPPPCAASERTTSANMPLPDWHCAFVQLRSAMVNSTPGDLNTRTSDSPPVGRRHPQTGGIQAR